MPCDLHAWLSAHFNAFRLSACNEVQLESEFIGPLLTELGWFKVQQQALIAQGKQAKPGWRQLLAKGQDAVFIAGKDHILITAICESKNWSKKLDSGMADPRQEPALPASGLPEHLACALSTS